MSETLNDFTTMTFRFAGFVLTVFPHVDCNRLGTNWGSGCGGGGRGLLKDVTYSFHLVYMSTYIFRILKTLSCSVFIVVMQTSSCSFSKGRISCLEFCGCRNEGCRNKWNMIHDNDDNNDSDNVDSDDEKNEALY